MFPRALMLCLMAAAMISCAGPVSRMPREVVDKIPLVDFHAHYPGRPPRTAEEFIRTMDSVGIERTVLLLGGTGIKEARELQKYSDRFALFFAGPAANDAVRAKIKTGDSKVVEELLADYDLALQSGLYSGLGEIYAYHSDRPTRIAPDSPAILGLLELVARYNVPISIHCTADGRPEMARALKSHPKATVIWAHAGDLGPSRTLAGELDRLGKPHKLLIFPRFGATAQEGHGFCGARGAETWGPDVLKFIETHLK